MSKKEPVETVRDGVRIDVQTSPWNMCTFYGRWRFYSWIFDPRLSLVSPKTIDHARELLRLYKLEKEPPETTDAMVVYAKRLYENSLHPDTGQKTPHFARFSFVLPSQLLLTAAMVTFCRTMPVVWFWQLANNGYHSTLNWYNGNATPVRTGRNQIWALTSATVAATLVTIPFKSKLSHMLCKNKFRTLVPFTVVLLSHAVNVPLSRQVELTKGVDIQDAHGKTVGVSRVAAAKGIGQVTLCRMLMFAPTMLVVPFITPALERKFLCQRRRWAVPLLQVLISTALITLMVPVSCAVFPQAAMIKTETLKHSDPVLYEKLVNLAECTEAPLPAGFYFNKGL